MSHEANDRPSYGLSETHMSLLDICGDPTKVSDYWEKFASKYRVTLKRWAMSKGVQEILADDISSVAETKMWAAISGNRYDPTQGRIRDWMKRIVRNETINFIRSISGQQNVVRRLIDDGQMSEEDPASDIEAIILKDFRDSFVAEARKRLIVSEPDWHMFIKRTELNIPYADLSVEFKKTPDALKQSVKRIRDKLQELARELEENGFD